MHASKKILLTFMFVFALGSGVCGAQGVAPVKLRQQAWQGYEQAMQRGEHAAAVSALERLSQFGDPKAMFFLGTHYSLGQGVRKDLKKSFVYFQKAAEAGDEEAKFMLGVAYLQGNGVEKNPQRAHEIFEQLAENNHPAAQYHLALLYGKGIGGEKDLSKARFWLKKAAAIGDPAAIKHLQRNAAAKH